MNKNNSLQIFENEQFGKVRIVEVNGEAWMVGKDIAEALGYANPSKAIIDHVDEDDKLNNETLSSLGQRGGWLVNESGLYSLVMSSKLPDAKKFKKWVTSEILPSIRKTGSYNAKPLSPAEMFLAQAQLNVEHEHRLSALEENQRRLVEVCGIPSIGRDEWQIKMKERISDLCQQYDLEYKSTYDELYRELEDKTGCNVESRRRNLRKRLRKAGATCKERDNVSKLMVVSKDLALATAFEGIVQRFAARIVSENM